ncbi:MAG: response regulator [Armatimonadetes bacterium]|nr:response regulator [Armatimonadota bacterium]
MVVDDDEQMAETLSDILEAKGYKVAVAGSGEQAIDRIAERRFDVILLDIRLPGMNGVETLRAIRRRCPESMVVMMTAYTLPDLIKKAEKEGALATLTKPLDMNKVLAFLREFQRSRRPGRGPHRRLL